MKQFKDSKLLKLVGLILVISVMIISLVYVFSKDPELLSRLIKDYGYVGLFLVSIAVNATVLFPLPIFDVAIFALAAAATTPLAPLFIGITVGIGAAIGEMTGYMIGIVGRKAAEEATGKSFKQLEKIKSIIKKGGMFIIYIGAIIPFPFDLVSISAGLIRYNPLKFFVAAICGKITRFVIFSYAGYYGISLIKTVFLH